MISNNEAKNIASKIRRGTDTIKERAEYDRWARISKGRRPRTSLAELLGEAKERAEQARRKRAAEGDLLERAERPVYTKEAPDAAPEDPIAPPLPLEGEIVDEPIAPPIDLPPPPEPTYDLGGGAAKAARAALEAIDAHNPEIGGISLAVVFGAQFWPAWEAAATRLIAKHVGSVNLADDELVIAGSLAVVGQPIAIPIVKEHGAEWLANIKSWFGGAS